MRWGILALVALLLTPGCAGDEQAGEIKGEIKTATGPDADKIVSGGGMKAPPGTPDGDQELENLNR